MSSFLLLAAGLPSNPLGRAVGDMRAWLDAEDIQPSNFRTVVGEGGLGFEISFREENEADRFVERFRSLISQ